MGLENFDVSYWLVRDKEWVEKRKKQWPAIERMVGLNRRKVEVNVIRQYFLKGKLPKWEKYKNWERLDRPLDLRLFLWLHPSEDYGVLKPLFLDFIQADCIHKADISLGYGSFLTDELSHAVLPYESLEQYLFVYIGAKNRVLFNVLFDDLSPVRDRLIQLFSGKEMVEYANPIFEGFGYLSFLQMCKWLIPKYKTPMIEHCLYQYPEVVDWCVTTLSSSNEREFLESIGVEVNVRAYQKVLYTFYHFDTDKEGDTCRTRFIHQIRKILDERDFVPEFKKMWEDVKSGRIVVDNAFEA